MIPPAIPICSVSSIDVTDASAPAMTCAIERSLKTAGLLLSPASPCCVPATLTSKESMPRVPQAGRELGLPLGGEPPHRSHRFLAPRVRDGRAAFRKRAKGSVPNACFMGEVHTSIGTPRHAAAIHTKSRHGLFSPPQEVLWGYTQQPTFKHGTGYLQGTGPATALDKSWLRWAKGHVTNRRACLVGTPSDMVRASFLCRAPCT